MSDRYHEWEDQQLLEEHAAHPERFREPILRDTPRPPCACGKPGAYWKGPFDGQRVYACDVCHKASRTPET